jgi:hypothetical protein
VDPPQKRGQCFWFARAATLQALLGKRGLTHLHIRVAVSQQPLDVLRELSGNGENRDGPTLVTSNSAVGGTEGCLRTLKGDGRHAQSTGHA